MKLTITYKKHTLSPNVPSPNEQIAWCPQDSSENIVLLILAVAGGVFAQDITWSGEVRTGAMIELGDGKVNREGDDAVIIKADDDDVPTGVKARLNAEVAGDNYGIQFGLAADIFDGDTSSTGFEMGKLVYFYNAHGWLDFVDGMVKVRAGLIDPGVWTTKGPEDFNVSSGLGFRLEVAPIEGLNVGALLNYGEAFAGIGADNEAPMEIGQFLSETAFGFSYANEAIMGLYASAAFKLDSDWADDVTDPYDGDSDDATLIFGLGLTPMEALGVKVEGKIEHLTAYSDKGWMWFVEDVTYQVMEPLQAGIRMDQQMASEDSVVAAAGEDGFEGYEMFLKFKPYATYAVSDAIDVGAEIPFALADNGDKLGFASIGAGLWGQYNVSETAWIKAYYGFTNAFKDYAPSFGTEAALTHTIRLLAGFTF